MNDDRAEPTRVPTDEWLALAASALGHGAPSVGEVERGLLLELARLAAHHSDRTAAPITTYMAGAVLGASDPSTRITRLRELVAELAGD